MPRIIKIWIDLYNSICHSMFVKIDLSIDVQILLRAYGFFYIYMWRIFVYLDLTLVYLSKQLIRLYIWAPRRGPIASKWVIKDSTLYMYQTCANYFEKRDMDPHQTGHPMKKINVTFCWRCLHVRSWWLRSPCLVNRSDQVPLWLLLRLTGSHRGSIRSSPCAYIIVMLIFNKLLVWQTIVCPYLILKVVEGV